VGGVGGAEGKGGGGGCFIINNLSKDEREKESPQWLERIEQSAKMKVTGRDGSSRVIPPNEN